MAGEAPPPAASGSGRWQGCALLAVAVPAAVLHTLLSLHTSGGEREEPSWARKVMFVLKALYFPSVILKAIQRETEFKSERRIFPS